MSVVSVFAIFADANDAERIGQAMVDDRLAACVNILGPVRSIYRWQGKVESADEVAATFKTSDVHADALMTRIAAMHSYEIPCIIASPIDKILADYAAWVEDSVR